MPEQAEEKREPFRLNVRCSNCGRTGALEGGDWPMQITGAVEVICPGCNRRTTYIGCFGHDLEIIQRAVDGAVPKIGENIDGG